ncbi:hypothetical protein TNCV_146921 [Trichonephila clavipes]|nr:hypothetical protein TNCV_146921 [Trichonephila clavipes]
MVLLQRERKQLRCSRWSEIITIGKALEPEWALNRSRGPVDRQDILRLPPSHKTLDALTKRITGGYQDNGNTRE